MSFKDHFSGHAHGYAAARPSYPRSLFAWLAQQAPRTAHAWDCATGSGQAAIGLAEHFASVTATDASAAQIDNAHPHPSVQYTVAPAEASGLAPASVDLVSVAQALHWFDHAAFYAEVRRVARPGAVLAAWTYGLTRVTPAVDRVVDTLYRDTLGPFWPPERHHIETGYRELPFPFAELAAPEFAIELTWTLADFVAYLRTWSAWQRHIATRGDTALVEIGERLARAWGDPGRVRTVAWPIALRAGRV